MNNSFGYDSQTRCEHTCSFLNKVSMGENDEKLQVQNAQMIKLTTLKAMIQ